MTWLKKEKVYAGKIQSNNFIMTASISTLDILSICLIMADDNVELSIEEIILRFENYQKTNDCTFSSSRSDFRTLLSNLIYIKLELKKIGEDLNEIKLKDVLNEIKLKDLIIVFLNHYSHYNGCF